MSLGFPYDTATNDEVVNHQLKEINDPIRPFVRCPGCLKKLRMDQAYRCLYCGIWWCEKCAETHFGQTKAERKAAIDNTVFADANTEVE